MKETKQGIYLAIYAILYCSVIQRYIWANQFVQLLPDIIIITICIFHKGLSSKIAKRNSISNILGKWIGYLYIIFFILGILSSIINMVNWVSILWGMRMLLRYGLLFLLVYKNFNFNDLISIRRTIDYSFYINTILIVFQFLSNLRGDSMGGIWSGNGTLAIYNILLTLLFTADYLYKRLSLKNYIFRISIIFLSSMWAEIKMLYFILPLCIYAVYVFLKKFSVKHIIILISAWFLSVPILSQVLSLYYDDNYVSQTLDIEKLQSYNENNYGFTDESLNRGTVFIKSNLFLESTKDKFIGHGLGSGTVSNFFSTYILEKYYNTFYHYFSISYLLMEVGYLGLSIFLIVHFILLYRFFSIYMKAKDCVLKYWSTLGVLSTLAAFIMIYYNSVPLSNYYFGYLFWAICCLVIRDRKLQLKSQHYDS